VEPGELVQQVFLHDARRARQTLFRPGVRLAFRQDPQQAAELLHPLPGEPGLPKLHRQAELHWMQVLVQVVFLDELLSCSLP
jgi:hypothetical protein